MDFAALKEKIRKEVEIDEPDFIKDNDEVLNICSVELNATQKIIFSISVYRGKKYFDIRTWFQGDSGEWSPTKKGIRLSFEKFADFEKAMGLIKEAVDRDR